MALTTRTTLIKPIQDTRLPYQRGRVSLLAMWRSLANIDGWTLIALAIATLVAIPLFTVAWLAFSPSGDIWSHLTSTVLPHYISTTLLLMLGVGIGVTIIGAGTAWLTATCRFPGSRIFEWALLLPLAVPAYIIAYIYTDILEYAGPVQGALRELMGFHSARDYWFPEIRSLGGAITMMVLTLYPYVYLLARAAFLEQSTALMEAGRVLGRGPWRNFYEIALPLARPAIVVGVSLALMETLNDFGTVDFFAVQTFTAGIYDVWLNMNNMAGAAQLAGVMMLFVFALIAMERLGRRGRRFDTKPGRSQSQTQHLTGWQAAIAFFACLLPVLLGFVLPATKLSIDAVRFFDESFEAGFLTHAWHSLLLSTTVAIVSVTLGLLLAYGVRLSGTKLMKTTSRIASIGYAVPGSVLAVGILYPLSQLDHSLNIMSKSLWGAPVGLLFSGTMFALVYGYTTRFMALSHGSVESGLGRITPNMEGAARSLGANRFQTLKRIHLPLLRGSLLTAALIVFVDSMKELPMTMLLRPFNFETLATNAHQYASDELFEEAALGSLAIVLAGILPVILLSKAISANGKGGK